MKGVRSRYIEFVIDVVEGNMADIRGTMHSKVIDYPRYSHIKIPIN